MLPSNRRDATLSCHVMPRSGAGMVTSNSPRDLKRELIHGYVGRKDGTTLPLNVPEFARGL